MTVEISTVDIRFEGQNLFYYISVFNSVDEQEFIKLLSTKIPSFVKVMFEGGGFLREAGLTGNIFH